MKEEATFHIYMYILLGSAFYIICRRGVFFLVGLDELLDGSI